MNHQPLQKPLRIAIVGGGLGGLTLAQALRHRLSSAQRATSSPRTTTSPRTPQPQAPPLCSITVFERDPDRTHRGQGFSISLRNDMGLTALRSAGVPDDRIQPLCSPTRNFHITTAGGWRLMSLAGGTPGMEKSPYFTVRVDRPKLRALLLEHALMQRDDAPTTGQSKEVEINVQFGAHVTGYQQQEDYLQSGNEGACGVRLLFAEGDADTASEVARRAKVNCPATQGYYDLVVACDGTRSKIRKQMLGEDSSMHGVTLITGRVPDGLEKFSARSGDEKRKALGALVNKTSTLFALSGAFSSRTIGSGDSIFVSPADDGAISWALGLRAAPGSIDGLTASEKKSLAQDCVRKWLPAIRTLVADTDASTVAHRDLQDRRFPATARNGRVVLLGDAAHPMTPFMGLGANTAMLDAVVLADAICETVLSTPGDTAQPSAGEKNVATIDAALASYDKEMLSRAKKCVDASRAACQSYHTKDGRVAMVTRDMRLWVVGCVMGLMFFVMRFVARLAQRK